MASDRSLDTRIRRLSQAISEGDGISVLVFVSDLGAARAAATDGAEGIALTGAVTGIREATSLPILYEGIGPGQAREAGADAWSLRVEHTRDEDELLERHYAEAAELGLECVVDVQDEEELELALERLDPEIFLLSPRDAGEDEDPLERILDLLPDVPAGKLAIAELETATRDEVIALERAGVDAVLVRTGTAGHLVGGQPPEV
jgi:indole-3-glycerol phosphate synthase